MARLKHSTTTRGSMAESPVWSGWQQNPELARMADKLFARYRKYAVPAAELSKELDREMGQRTLTQELHEMPEGR